MKRTKVFLIFSILVFIGLGVSIWLVKTQPKVKSGLKELLGSKKETKTLPIIYQNATKVFFDKPEVLGTVPAFSLIDQDGQPFGHTDLKEGMWVLNFIRTQDGAAATERMKVLQGQLSKYPLWNDVSFASISMDPENDEPEVLKAYRNSFDIAFENWKLLTGNREDIWTLCKEGFLLDAGANQPEVGSPLLETSVFLLIDRKGNVRGSYNTETADDMDHLLTSIRALIVERPGVLAIPENIVTPVWLDDRKEEQLKTLAELEVYHDFSFSDQLAESGITFRHQVTEVGGKYMQAVHYDHGNGMAVADVDGDGWEDIYFISQIGTNQLWRNLGDGRFEDITEKAGLGMKDVISVTASFADTDNDGDPDLYVTTVRSGNRFFENKGDGVFADVSSQSGLNHKGHSSGTVFFDYDKDGLLDLFVTNVGVYTKDSLVEMTVENPYNSLQNGTYSYYATVSDAFRGFLMPERFETSILFKNKGNNQFEDVTAATKMETTSWSGDATALDANNDGWTDLYLLSMHGDDEYYENVGGKYFEKRTEELFPQTPRGAMGVKVFDYNNDGHLDMYITDMHSDMGPNQTYGPDLAIEKAKIPYLEKFEKAQLFGNAFFENQGNGQFKEVSDEINAENYWPWGLSVGDLNADGFDDAFLTSSMNYSFRYAVNSLMLNNKGKKFMDSEFILGVEPRKDGIHAKYTFSIDCSGADKDHYLCEGRTGKYEVFEAMGSRSSVIVDIDHDGDLDIITSEYNGEPMVLISNLSDKKPDLAYLKIKLKGVASNSDGIGAVVKVTTESTTQTKVNDGKSGYLSQSSYPLYFGLGNDVEVKRIEVIWPSGKSQIIADNISTNELLTIVEE